MVHNSTKAENNIKTSIVRVVSIKIKKDLKIRIFLKMKINAAEIQDHVNTFNKCSLEKFDFQHFLKMLANGACLIS